MYGILFTALDKFGDARTYPLCPESLTSLKISSFAEHSHSMASKRNQDAQIDVSVEGVTMFGKRADLK